MRVKYFRTTPCVHASQSFSDDIRGYDRTTTPNASTSKARPVTGMSVSIPHLASLLLDLNVEGQHIIRAVVEKGDLGVTNKNEGDVKNNGGEMDAQTEADRRVEAHVLRSLRSFCPELTVVAEESFENPTAGIPEVDTFDDLPIDTNVIAAFPNGVNGVIPKSDFARLAIDGLNNGNSSSNNSSTALDWPPHLLDEIDTSRVVVFLDPLDGTNEFAAGERQCVTSLMGISVDGSPVVGIIGQPFFVDAEYGQTDTPSGRIVWGGRGLGVLGVDVTPLEETYSTEKRQLTCCINRDTKDDRLDSVVDELHLDPRFRVSATGFHSLLLLEGKVDCALLLRAGTKKWDSCPGEALLRAVGGSVTDSAGRLYDYSDARGALNLSGLVSTRDARRHFDLVNASRRVAARNESGTSYYPLNVDDRSVRPALTPITLTTHNLPPGGYRLVTVDVGGCLLTPTEKVTATYLRLAKSMGLDMKVTEETILSAIRAGFKRPVPANNPPGVRYVGDGRSFWRSIVFEALGGELSDEEMEKALNLLYSHYEKASSWHVAPGAKRALRALRADGVYVAVVSNWDTRLPTLLRRCGFDETHFNTVVVSAEVESDKPDAKIFQIAIDRINAEIISGKKDDGKYDMVSCQIRPFQVLHVGDSRVNDVDGSLDFGFGGAFLWNSEMRGGSAFDFQEVAEFVVDSRRV